MENKGLETLIFILIAPIIFIIMSLVFDFDKHCPNGLAKCIGTFVHDVKAAADGR